MVLFVLSSPAIIKKYGSAVMKKTKYTRCKALREVGDQWWTWMAAIRKSKAIYHHLNLFSLDVTKNCLIGRCWTPTQDLKNIQRCLHTCSIAASSAVSSFLITLTTHEVPPTYNRINKFTNGFQNLINAYGDAAYMELNPGFYTIITFPFLFAVMFGDMGHAVIMASFAAWMVINEKKFEAEPAANEIWNIFFKGRYVILLMGIFSLYTGFVYNDAFSKALQLAPSAWSNELTWEKIKKLETKTLPMGSSSGTTYMFGVDPVWSLSKNSIIFSNSLKMKMSIILGVIHMIFGVMLSLFNHLYFKHYHAVFLEFIPQFLFLTCLFLYLVFMMFFKWFSFTMYNGTNVEKGNACAPLILIYFIDMMLMKTTKGPFENCPGYMYPNQQLLQRCLLFLALMCVPIMLFGSPVYVSFIMKTPADMDEEPHKKKPTLRPKKSRKRLAEHDVHVTKPPFSELMITQGVHTIEFVLSTVSHTASYLRLWALSLAHAQLSEMLWQMIFAKLGLADHSRVGAIKVFAIFAIWATFTVAIMVLMEGLSAFLHTLRLHWVEFMSKFFIGGGTKFSPFCFKEILRDEGDEKMFSTCGKTTTKKSKGKNVDDK